MGFLGESIVRQVVEMAKIRCPGCSDKTHSPLLHLHEQISLLDKLKCYFEEIRGTILPTIRELYEQFKHKLPHSNDPLKDEECYIENGRHFLIKITADALYYGRYLNDMNDSYVNEGFKMAKKKPIQKRARVAGTKVTHSTRKPKKNFNDQEQLIREAMERVT